MKKLLSVVAIIAIVLMLGVANVNAASIKADSATVKAGDTVTVTVTTNGTEMMEFDVKFDADKFEYVEGSLSVDLANKGATPTEGNLFVSAYEVGKSATTATLQFKAKADVEGEATFTIANTDFEPVEEVTTATATVAVEKATAEEPKTEDPKAEEPKASETTANTVTDTAGNKVTKLPQTGAETYVVAGLVLVVAIAAVAVVARKK